jgi:hypothetical protein
MGLGGIMSRKNSGFIFAFYALSLVLVLLAGLFVFSACDDGSTGTASLIGTWKLSGDGFEDVYTITETSLIHNDLIASIEFTYKFSKKAGCLIVKYANGSVSWGTDLSNKYSAVYYKDLNAKTVVLGDAYGPDYTDPSVDTLEEAKTKFSPANASLYGGDLEGAGKMNKE